MAKWMWIVAGPNGAGKSSFAGRFLANLGHDLIKLNADERTLELRKHFTDTPQNELNLQAAIAVDKDVGDCIAKGRSFVVETVLSSQKYRDDVTTAKENGFKIGLIYVSLYPPELSPQRVDERVKKGGHNVDYEKAIQRHKRSHEELSWFAQQADTLFVFDNSSPDLKPVLVALKGDGQPMKYLVPRLNPSLDNALKVMPATQRKSDLTP